MQIKGSVTPVFERHKVTNLPLRALQPVHQYNILCPLGKTPNKKPLTGQKMGETLKKKKSNRCTEQTRLQNYSVEKQDDTQISTLMNLCC